MFLHVLAFQISFIPSVLSHLMLCLPPDVCRMAHVIYVISICLPIVLSNSYCVVFMFCFPSVCAPYVAVSLDCPFLIVPSVFSNVYVVFWCHVKIVIKGNSSAIKQSCTNAMLIFDKRPIRALYPMNALFAQFWTLVVKEEEYTSFVFIWNS